MAIINSDRKQTLVFLGLGTGEHYHRQEIPLGHSSLAPSLRKPMFVVVFIFITADSACSIIQLKHERNILWGLGSLIQHIAF